MNTHQGQFDAEIQGHDKNLIPVTHYNQYNHRRYGTPWVAVFNDVTGRPDFEAGRVGMYTGGYNTGDAGYVVVQRPAQTTVYAFGQKDYRSARGGYNIAIVTPEGDVVTMSKQEYLERAFVSAPTDN